MNRTDFQTVLSRVTVCLLPLLLVLVTLIRILLLKKIDFVPLLPFETLGFLALFSTINAETADPSTLSVILSYLACVLIPALVTAWGGYLLPRKRGWGLLLLLVPIGIEFIIAVTLAGTTGSVIYMMIDAVFAVILIIASGAFTLERKEHKDLSFYEKF